MSDKAAYWEKRCVEVESELAALRCAVELALGFEAVLPPITTRPRQILEAALGGES